MNRGKINTLATNGKYTPYGLNITLASLGATTVGQNLVTLPNPSAIRFIRINADNTVDALSASDFRTAIGAGTGSGTVTSVGGTTNRITSSGGTSPVIDIAATYVGQTSITTLGTIATGTWQGTAIADAYISSAATWNAKQAALSGTGVVKSTAGTISYITDKSDYINTVNKLGFAIKHQSLGVELTACNVASGLVDGQMRFQIVGTTTEATTMTTIVFMSSVQGSFTADNENSVSLYSVNQSTGLFTRLGVSANDGNIWKNAANTLVYVSLSSPVNVAADTVLAVGMLYNSSAQTTAPSLAAGYGFNNAAYASAGLSNSVDLYGFINSQTASPSTQAASGISATNARIWCSIY